jgi:hypothetical protein
MIDKTQWRKFAPHALAVLIFIALTYIYFSPVLDGKVIRQGDIQNFSGMSQELNKYYQDTGETSAWLGNMFGGMPSYQTAIYGLPENQLSTFEFHPVFSYSAIRPLFIGALSFYILMCVMGCGFWLSLLGAIAFSFASYNIIIIEAGHNTKAYAIAYIPLVMAGMMQLFKKKYLWGFVLFALGVSMLVYENHLQITFYTMLFCLFVYLGYLIIEIKSKDYKSLLKASGLMVVGVALAACTGLGSLYGNWEMSKASLRGPTELTPDPVSSNPNERVSSGLDKDYAFQWSYGWKELLSTLIPNVYGGPSGGVLSSDSNLAKEYRAHGVQSGSELRAPTYWGDKPFTSGPVYFGAIVCFLFVLGMFVVKNPLKWWIFGGGLFLAFLALGRNFDLFNDFMFHHLPLYNKFRTPEMALVIPEFVFPLIGVWGLKEIFTRKVTDDEFKKGFCWSLGITGGLSLIIWLMPSLLLSFRSNYDAQFQSQGLEWYYNALLMDREAIASADALRSLVFILLGAALLFWYWKAKKSKAWLYTQA